MSYKFGHIVKFLYLYIQFKKSTYNKLKQEIMIIEIKNFSKQSKSKRVEVRLEEFTQEKIYRVEGHCLTREVNWYYGQSFDSYETALVHYYEKVMEYTGFDKYEQTNKNWEL